jgi:hypothetical protein
VPQSNDGKFSTGVNISKSNIENYAGASATAQLLKFINSRPAPRSPQLFEYVNNMLRKKFTVY